MKEEAIFGKYDHYLQAKEHEAASRELKEANPGSGDSVEVETGTKLQRFDALQAGVSQFLPEGRSVTPILPVAYEVEDRQLILNLRLCISTDSDGCEMVSADWEDDQVSKVGRFRSAEEISRDSLSSRIADDSRAAKLEQLLSDVEWSLVAYTKTAMALTPEEAEEMRFPADFVERLRTASAEAAEAQRVVH